MYDYKVFLTEHCKNGHDFEVVVLKLLTGLGFEARLTSGDDNGVDIIASITLGGYFKKYYIQCKFHNKTIGKAAVQEVYTGTQYFGGDGQPVVIAANKMSLVLNGKFLLPETLQSSQNKIFISKVKPLQCAVNYGTLFSCITSRMKYHIGVAQK